MSQCTDGRCFELRAEDICTALGYFNTLLATTIETHPRDTIQTVSFSILNCVSQRKIRLETVVGLMIRNVH